MKNRLVFLSVVLFFFINEDVDGQSVILDKGWSQNSINAVVFRKNSIVSYKNMQYVAYYDTIGYLTLAKRKLKSANWKINKTQYKGNLKNAHCSISIMIDGDGYLHVAWNNHNSKLLYCKSKKAGSLNLKEPEFMVGKNEEKVTYPEFYKFPNGDLFFLYRDGSSGNGNLIINRYHTNVQRWTRVHERIISGEKRRNAYWQAYIDDNGVFHISWVWRESGDVSTNHDMCYAKSTDFGKSWLKSDNTLYKLPITELSAELVCRIPQNSNLINQTSMIADETSTPYIATYYSRRGDSVPQYFLFYKDDNNWKTVQMTNRKFAFSLKGGGTKKIPISRPQIVVDKRSEITKVILIYRDIEYDNKIVIAMNKDSDFKNWQNYAITSYSLGSWEPTYDTELWRQKSKLHLYVQKVGQGDGETLENIPAQYIKILNVEIE